jgi:hypothetical protein
MSGWPSGDPYFSLPQKGGGRGGKWAELTAEALCRQVKPSKPALAQVSVFCANRAEEGKLKLPDPWREEGNY